MNESFTALVPAQSDHLLAINVPKLFSESEGADQMPRLRWEHMYFFYLSYISSNMYNI